MSYLTLQGLIDRYGEDELIQLTDRAGDGVADVAVVARAIADAEAEIDAYLANRMALPLATVPAILERLAAAIVRHSLYKDAAPETVEKARDAAIALLRDVSAGRASLGPSNDGAATPATAAPSYSSVAPVFDDAGLAGY
ncbi:MAG: DUF1320 domain-containing protein [Pseudomonadota bacterium]|nr:DUF1320 domain-containing protein [Pseudomonadota bacterium]